MSSTSARRNNRWPPGTPGGAVRLLDSVIAAHPENTAARLLPARAFFAAAQLRPAELEFEPVLAARFDERD